MEATMDELVRTVAQRTGLDEAKARTAVETVMGFLKGRLPGPVAQQLDGVLGGQDVAGGTMGGVGKGLGGILGG
jgi:hypothetical protein